MSEQKTIQEMIWEVINDISANQHRYDAEILSKKIVALSTLYGNLTEKIADFEHDYQVKLGIELDKNLDKPYNKVELEARRSDEYYRLKKAQALERAVIQIIRASNKYIKIKTDEHDVAKYQ